ncbi:NAD(P)H-binding protein [Halococcoides cellulosivorans]|uniref:NAD(P)-dependent oxidoreductase n=1 Tax=Halococcoides cellulosivorans TaxID=1679096 RepID=A0A2R4X4H3_9EURY|nr:NAD(P)-dependent oxidoreductase [Halococcoides cellulosivorans]
MDSVAILGCGWVGCELGRILAGRVRAVGVRRSDAGLERVRGAGIDAVQADLTDADSLARVPDVEALVVAATPDDRTAAAARRLHVDGLRTAIDHFSGREAPPDRLVYVSSTGVYGDHGGDWVDESTEIDPPTAKLEAIATAERITRERSGAIDGTVARFGGLYGPERYRMARYVEGPVTAGWLNSIHRDDAAGAIAHLIATDARPDIVNVVDGSPVEKHRFADWLAEQCGRPQPPKRSVAERIDALDDPNGDRGARIRAQKRVAGDRLRSLGFRPRCPSARAGFAAAVAAGNCP